MKKIAAEEARAAAAEKARLAEQEKARLAAEGAKQAEQAKAAAAAKQAEEARIVAEKAREAEQQKAAAAEKVRLEEQEKARKAAEKAKQTEEEKTVAERKEKLAVLSPTPKLEQPQVDPVRALQAELRRVGCNTGAVDANWNESAQRALDLFNKHAGMTLDIKTASADALDAVRGKTGRICPLICRVGYRADGDRCVKITCEAGYELNDDGACEKLDIKKKSTAKREVSKPKRERAKLDAVPGRSQASGQIICTSQGCRPVAKGCYLTGTRPGGFGGNAGAGQPLQEVCP